MPNGERAKLARITGRLLVTGATGFIGGAVLAELLDTELWPDLLILVRAPTLTDGKARILHSIRRFRPDAASDSVALSQILLADLHEADELARDPRLARVTHVVHSAAVTSFSNAARVADTNVKASAAFLDRLSKFATVERFVNVGTAWSAGFASDVLVMEGDREKSDVHLVPYTKSKGDFERLVRRDYPHVPFISVRPSIVVGHTRLGTAPSGSIYWVFRAASILGAFTCRLEDRIDVVPVDWVARSLIAIATKPHLSHDTYHLSSGLIWASRFGDLDEPIARGRGCAPWHDRYRHVDESTLFAIVRRHRAELGPINPWLLCRALSLYGRFARANTFFDNARALSEGLAPPPPFHSYAEICAATAENMLLSEQMAVDFK